MSENKDNESPITDSQETFYDKSQDVMESQMLHESQDFALIVGEDSDESTKNNSPGVQNIDGSQTDGNPVEKNVVEAEAEGINEDLTTREIDKETPNVLTQVDDTKKEEVIESSNMEDDVEDTISKEKRGSDEDEIIQGTPPEISSPSRKLISGKRKGDSLDEPASKIQRTLPQRDALKLERENLANRIGKGCIDFKSILSNVAVPQSETQSDILCENTEYFDTNEKSESCPTQSHPQNIVIEETQDPEDSEPIVFGNTSNEDKEEAKDESQESGEKDKAPSEQCDPQSDTTNTKKPMDSKIEDPQPSQKEDPQISEKEDLQPSTKEDPQLNKTEVPQPNEKAVSTTPDTALETRTNGEADEKITEDNKAVELMDVSESDLTDEKTCTAEESTEEKDEGNRPDDKNWLNTKLPTSDSASDSNCEAGSNSSNKSRKSVELIYDRKSASQEKNKIVELVKIDEEGEEIILDSSNEELLLRFSTGSSNNSPQNTTVYKSCVDSKSNSESSYQSTTWTDPSKRNVTETSDCQLTNGEEERTISGSTKTISSGSDQLADDLIQDTIPVEISKSAANDSDIVDKYNLSSKLNDTMELANMVSDSDGDSLLVNENAQSSSQYKANISSNTSAATKTTTYEKKIRFHVELKYLVHVDDNTKEIVSKEVTDVQCEPLVEVPAAGRNDTSGSLGDISGNANRDTSPGSVISNAQPFPLPMSRFSIASTISSSSSASSAASLAVKLFKDANFPLPKGRAKHARRPAIGAVLEEKLDLSENFEKVIHGWKNAQLITDTFLQSANMAITSGEIYQHDTETDKHEEKVLSSTPEPGPIKEQVLSSTPEPVQDEKVTSQLATPKSTKDKKPVKRSRAKSNSSTRSNGLRKASPELISTSQEDRVPMIKKKRETLDAVQPDKSVKQTATVATPSRLRPETPRKEALRSLTPQNLPGDELVGKVVFARWSDNNYYPGEVTEKTKGKFRVKFYDGKSKLLIEEFLIPMPKVLRDGLSVYATTKEDDYGSMGIILQSEEINHVMYYTVEMDDGTRVKVQTKDIFLMPGQAQILKEEVEMESRNVPRTPQHSGGVSLDNLVDGKRRQPVTPTVSTPKSRQRSSPRASRITDNVPPSGSGISKVKGKPKEMSSSESDSKTTDSNISSIEDVDGVQPELVTMPAAQISKGPSSRMKGRGRSKSKQTQSDVELGPIPPASSTIFKNMSFILTSTSSDIIPRHHTDDSCSETGTENEEEWLKTPFIKERVKTQLINGGGTVYDSFKSIPPSEYKNTKLITNAPNLTAKSIQCLSVGISVYRHVWVIQCCRENKTLKPSRFELPAGWSLEKNMYIESYDRVTKQPFNDILIGMPMLDNKNAANRSIQFWRRICENAGAKVEIIDDPGKDFPQITAILTDNRCPSWLVEKADNWEIPLVSTVWIVQCIITGQLLSADTHPQYKHTFIQS